MISYLVVEKAKHNALQYYKCLMMFALEDKEILCYEWNHAMEQS